MAGNNGIHRNSLSVLSTCYLSLEIKKTEALTMSFSCFSFHTSSTKLISVCPAKAVMLRSALYAMPSAWRHDWTIPSHSESSKLPVPNKGSTHSAFTWLRSSECEITSRVWRVAFGWGVQAANKILKLGNWTEYVVASQYIRIMKGKNRNSTHGFFCHKRLGLKENAMHGITPHLELQAAVASKTASELIWEWLQPFPN